MNTRQKIEQDYAQVQAQYARDLKLSQQEYNIRANQLFDDYLSWWRQKRSQELIS